MAVAPLVPAALQKELGTVDVRRPMGMWGDLWEATPELRFPFNLDIYDRMRRQDAQTRSLLRATILPVLGTKWRLAGTDVRPEVMQMVEAELGLQEDDQGRRRPREGGISWDKLLRHVMLHLPMGFAPLCRWYTLGAPDFPGLPNEVAHLNLSPRMPRTIWGFDENPDTGLLDGIWQNTISANVGGLTPGIDGRLPGFGQLLVQAGGGAGLKNSPDRVLIDKDHLVMFINEQEGSNWAGESILRATYKHWLIKDMLIRIGALAADRTGMGVPVVTYPRDEEGARSTALTLASQVRAGEDSGLALPAGWTLEILGVKGTVEDALKWVEYHDKAASRSMLAMFLDLGHSAGIGSGQTTDAFVDYFLLAEKACLRYVEEIFTEDIIRPFCAINFGPGEAYPTLVADDPRSESEPTATAIATLVKEGIVTPDEALRQDVRRRFGLPAEPDGVYDEANGGSDEEHDEENQPVGETGRTSLEIQKITMSVTNLVRAGYDKDAAMTYLGLKPLASPPPPPAPVVAPDGADVLPTDVAPADATAAPLVPSAVVHPPSTPLSPAGPIRPKKALAGADRRGTELYVGDAVMVALPDGIEPGLVFAGQDGHFAVELEDDDTVILDVYPKTKVQLLAAAGDQSHAVPASVQAAVREGIRLKAPDKPTPSISTRLLSGHVSHADAVFLAGWFVRRNRVLPSTGKPREDKHLDGKTYTKHGVNILLRGGEGAASWAKSAAGGVKASAGKPSFTPADDVGGLVARLERLTASVAALAAAQAS